MSDLINLVVRHLLGEYWWLNALYALTVLAAIILLTASVDSYRRNRKRQIISNKSPELGVVKSFWNKGMRCSVERITIALAKFTIIGILTTYDPPLTWMSILRRVGIVVAVMSVDVVSTVNSILDAIDDADFDAVIDGDDFELTFQAALSMLDKDPPK